MPRLPKAPRGKDENDSEARAARDRVITIIDAIPPEDLVSSIKRAPSLRGMILGYIAEEMFEKHVPMQYPALEPHHLEAHDDHDRSVNKSDRTLTYRGRRYGIQLKSIQTNSIGRGRASGKLEADVQNDASDKRTVILQDGAELITTCYVRGEYDVLAVPLFPFTGTWDYAYKRNLDCRTCASPKYRKEHADQLLATTEKICWPLSEDWTTDLLGLLDDLIGSLVSDTNVVPQPGGKVRVVEPSAVILPLEDKEV